MEYKLRAWRKEDIHDLVEAANNFNIARFMMDQFPHPYTKEKGLAFIEYASNNDPLHIFAIEVEGKACGGIGIHPQGDVMKKNAEMGYWLAEPHWGKGIISRAIMEMIDYGFKKFDIDRIYARPFGNNAASQHVLEKCGFALEARFEKTIFKNGEYLDELVYAVRRK